MIDQSLRSEQQLPVTAAYVLKLMSTYQHFFFFGFVCNLDLSGTEGEVTTES